MRLAVAAVVAVVVLVANAARADPVGDSLKAKAEDCISAAAPKVTAAMENLNEAVKFLTENLCAVEIKHAQTYQTSASILENLKATTAPSQVNAVTIDPTTGELREPPGFSPPMNMQSIMLSSTYQLVAAQPPAEFKAFAARAVLGARAK